MIRFQRYNDAMHWRIMIPLSRSRVQWYSCATDQMEPLRKWWMLTWKREGFCGNCTEIRIRFGTVYA